MYGHGKAGDYQAENQGHATNAYGKISYAKSDYTQVQGISESQAFEIYVPVGVVPLHT